MGVMPLTDMPWWRWRTNVRLALRVLSGDFAARSAGFAGRERYGDVTDAVYRLVEDTWLDNWSAEKYVGTIFRDSAEATAVDTAALRVLRIMHQVGADAPVSAYLEHRLAGGGPRGTQGPCDARRRRGGPGLPPRSLDVIRIMTRAA
ncbi:putative protein OS=Streptomyces tendae OX=1932 GN=F3L20_29555 PE=4 SV=1 [Streptomyces tendae]